MLIAVSFRHFNGIALMVRETSDPIDVSVIVAAWNAAAFIERAIASALASTGVRLEVIVVDDASADDGFEILRRLAEADSRIVADRLAINSGPSVARNRAIALASGRYIAVLDADDKLAPGRLAGLIELADRTGADIAVDNMLEVDEAQPPAGAKPFLKSDQFARSRYIDLAAWVRFNQPMKPIDCLGYLKPLIRRSKLSLTGIGYDPALRNSEDYYLVANLLAAGARMIYTPEPGYLYTRSTSSTSHRLQPEQTRAWLEAERRFMARFGDKASIEEKTALAMRGRLLRGVHQLVSAIDVMKARKIGAFFGLLASDPAASPFTLSFLAKIAMGKALRRKLV
jgi:succinoglycan biosynthesis protein ExoO